MRRPVSCPCLLHSSLLFSSLLSSLGRVDKQQADRAKAGEAEGVGIEDGRLKRTGPVCPCHFHFFPCKVWEHTQNQGAYAPYATTCCAWAESELARGPSLHRTTCLVLSETRRLAVNTCPSLLQACIGIHAWTNIPCKPKQLEPVHGMRTQLNFCCLKVSSIDNARHT